MGKSVGISYLSGVIVSSTFILCAILFGVIGTVIANLVISARTESKLGALLPSSQPASSLSACPELEKRRVDSFTYRTKEAYGAYARGYTCHENNGDEALYLNTDRRASFSKGLQHDAFGHVLAPSYNSLLNAINSRGDPNAFAAIQMGGTRKLINPRAGLAFDLEGADSHSITLPPPPKFSSARMAAEIVENYWMARLRDVSFASYGASPLAASAIADLNALSDYGGLKPVTAANLFRGAEPGCLNGPYLSQFFYLPCGMGANTVEQKIDPITPGQNFMTTWTEYLNIQNGGTPSGVQTHTGVPRYMINGRDISYFVHIDQLFQAYLQAALILGGLGAPLKAGIPYQTAGSKEEGFATFGGPHIITLLSEVATRALKAQWHQKWHVHRRLRPEAFAARVDRHKTGAYIYSDLHSDVLNSAAVTEIFSTYGSYLLPQAFPEGSPTHPTYSSGHSSVAGACVTILKAFYQENWVIPSPVKPSADGSTLVPYTDSDLTVGGELNKVASNVAIGRNVAGGKIVFPLLLFRFFHFFIYSSLPQRLPSSPSSGREGSHFHPPRAKGGICRAGDLVIYIVRRRSDYDIKEFISLHIHSYVHHHTIP